MVSSITVTLLGVQVGVAVVVVVVVGVVVGVVVTTAVPVARPQTTERRNEHGMSFHPVGSFGNSASLTPSCKQ